MHPWRDTPGPGQESVWDYPRPAIAEPCALHIMIRHAGQVIADTRDAVRTLETSHPPSYYIPPSDIDMTLLHPAGAGSICEWKGQAGYYDVTISDERMPRVGWTYRDPTPAFSLIRDHVAFYAAPFEECLVDGQQVTPQPGDFYGGWITDHVSGPFKGIPGSRFW